MLIVGTGAVASFLAEKLSAAGRQLQFFGAPSDRLHSLTMRFDATGVSQASQVQNHRLWIVAVKTWQNESKIQALTQAPMPQAILILQNGLAPEKDWRAVFGERVERGLSTYGVKSHAPGLVTGGREGAITLQADSAFAQSLRSAGLNIRESESMEQAIWHKLAVNASLNVVASIFGLQNGEVLQYPETSSLMRRAAGEVSRVAQALGLDWGPESAWSLARQVAHKTSQNVCSTLADLRADRPTEYQAINGAVLSRAREYGVPTPVLDKLHGMFVLGGQKFGGKTKAMPTYRASLPLLSPEKEARPLKAVQG